MGACYAVEISLQFKDTAGSEEAATKALRKYIKTARANFHLDRFAKEGVGTDTFDDLMRILLAGFKNHEVIIEDHGEWRVYSNEFDASYSYEPIMVDAFEAISPYLKNGSSIKLWPDNDHCEWTVHDEQMHLSCSSDTK